MIGVQQVLVQVSVNIILKIAICKSMITDGYFRSIIERNQIIMFKNNTYNLSNKSYISLLIQSILIILLLVSAEILLVTFIDKPLFYSVAIVYTIGILGLCKLLKIKLFQWKLITKKQWVIIIISLLIMGLINFIVAHTVSSVSNESSLDNMTSGATLFLLLLTFGLFVPIIEECIYRAFLIKGIFRGTPIIGSIISIILFTLAHTPTNIWEYLIFGFSSIIYVVAFMKTQRLEVPILIHILNNILGVLI